VSEGASEFSGTERFEVVRRLGAGGMGVVYEVLDRQRGVRCALKALKHLEAEAIFRFKNEFHTLSDLHHPNLVHLDELFSRDGKWFFTMEFVDGIDLLSWVRGVPAPDISPHADTLHEARRVAQLPTVRVPSPVAAPGADEVRLRKAMVQLALGLNALHAAGKVHRDIKPSNVLVTAEGRAVLLDLGLVIDAADGDEHTDENVVGTAAFMAPEQAAGKPLGPAADWYATGVVLYQALTGRLPFAGQPLEVLLDKQRYEPAAPRAIAPGVPEDLDALCVDLLHFDPALRPAGRTVLHRLGVREHSLRLESLPSTSSSGHGPPFIGRSAELAQLEDALAQSRSEGAVALLLEGESGVGKSGLVRRFTGGVTGVVLAGRCYERESVPYKGFDGVIDALSRTLRRLPRAEATRLLPEEAGLLPQVFPVLGRVEALAQAPRAPAGPIVDPHELRRRVFAAVRALFARIAEERPLVVVIDDLQWTDADSLALLAELLKPPRAPSLLLIATMRPGLEHAGGMTPEEVSAALRCPVRRLALSRLPPDEARALAALLLERGQPLAQVSAEAIAEEAGGHPLFIDELVRHWLQSGATAPAPLKLDEVLAARVERLDPRARQLLELVAVAGAPLPEDTARAAADAEVAQFGKLVALLRVAHLVRGVKAGGADGLEPYHDRVREAILNRLAPERRLRCHERLAVALEVSGDADPERLAVHWREAGATEKAGSYAQAAAEQAAAALAFDRAARLYRRALELKPVSGAEALRLRTQLGHALANAGRGAEAAAAYTEASKDANPAEKLELQRRAAVQLLHSGRVDEGLEALRSVLASVGMKLARTRSAAIASFLLRRARIRLRGLHYRARDASQIPADLLTRIDVAFSVTEGLGMVDYTRAADFQARHLLLALEAGEPYRVVQALCGEANFRALAGGARARSAQKLLDDARAIATERNDVYLRAFTDGSTGMVAFQRGDWRTCIEHTARAENLFRDRCTGVVWELNTARLFHLFALNLRGQLGEMNARLAVLIKSAQERGDLYTDVVLRTSVGYFPFLAADDPAGGRRDLDDALGRWSSHGFNLERMQALMSSVYIELYAGDSVRAWELLERAWPEVKASLLLRATLLRGIFLTTRARAAMSAASVAGTPALYRAVDETARELDRQEHTFCHAFAHLCRATLAHLRGDDATAAQLLARAESLFASADLGLFRQAARFTRGRLIGGADGKALADEADAYLRSEGMKVPARVFATCTPGWRCGARG
jgi:serine/threonine protein kinase/tetratricopeptide (TPR) repeat protein